MKPLATSAVTTLVLISAIAGAYGRGSPHGPHSTQDLAAEQCGWKDGSLPDPAYARKCIADRYKSAQRTKAPTPIEPPPASSDSAGKQTSQ